MVQRRKLQIFLSSTYSDLIEHRLVAVEAILAAGHIPAAMEQFTAGDETAWEKIVRWIDESDAYILILGGRYGSIEPESGKSYTQLEYEYALEHQKPFFSLVIDQSHLESRIQKEGLKVDERDNPELYKEFKKLVLQKHCDFWQDKKDIKSSIFQKLPEWAQREDLEGWIRGTQGVSSNLAEELARLSHENAELRQQVSQESFNGLTFEQMIDSLRQESISEDIARLIGKVFNFDEPIVHRGHVFEAIRERVACGYSRSSNAIDVLIIHGLVVKEVQPRSTDALSMQLFTHYKLSDVGIRFSNKLLSLGDLNYRLREIW